ncbi:hypothetical protein HD554DRAFT_2166739 [Boletus coccyginus]|nr:hypothetical protein HD554DRAFT_2166739 [Boletus coccyginus]
MSSGASIARTPSRESLTVHPLLNVPSDSARYVPYTPRQRSTATAPRVNLKAAAQSIGLEPTSIGWAILDKISYEGDTSDEWSEIWNALTKARATLLLPAEPSSGHDSITPEFVQDHLVVSSRENTAVVTLSGLRGQLANGSLTFRSTLHRSAKSFQGLFSPSASRAASLDALPPLPAYPPESSYPSVSVSALGATLPLPSRATKPPLPPRPGVRGAPSSGRLPMPFASLWGQRPSTPPPPTTTTVPTTTDVDTTIDISALIIDTVLSRTDIATAINSALKAEIAVALNDHPPWIVERVHTFVIPFLPFVRVPAGKKKLQDIGGNPNRVVYAVNPAPDKPEELADKFQAFYRAVEGELRNAHVRVEEGGRLDSSAVQDARPVGEMEEADEARIRDVLETIEATLSTLLYDRQVLFLPSTSDDASHNEALSSRIAALNMLDLGLEHLDVDIGDANHAEVDAAVRTCGQTLAQLDLSARSPREKATVLVSAHKLVVEGLSRIPPVRLKSREDDIKDSTKIPSGPTVATEQVSTPGSPPASTETQSPSVPAMRLSTSPDQLSVIKRSLSPETAPPSISSPVSGDVLFPILIFSVVKANPPRLLSHLLFIQRFRNQSFGGEESYCLINLMAVAEFLENVDLGALGLGESEKVISTADLTPIPITRPNLPESPVATAPLGEEHLASLRGRVEQGVDAIAGSANKVILGVVDSSFGVLRAFLPGQGHMAGHGGVGGTRPAPWPAASAPSGPGSGSGAAGMGAGMWTGSGSPATVGGETGAAPWGVRPGLGLLRRETGFSIAGLTGALPGVPSKPKSQYPEEEGQRELVEVSLRPPSVRSHKSGHESGSEETEEEEEEASEGESDGEEEEGEEGEDKEEEEEVHDTRSIKSFESMLSGGRTRRKNANASAAPPSSTSPSGSSRRRKQLSNLTGRFTHGMAEMSRRVQGGDVQRASISAGRFPPPNRRFVECTEQDIRVSEVGELLREYQRLVEAVRSAGGFQE